MILSKIIVGFLALTGRSGNSLKEFESEDEGTIPDLSVDLFATDEPPYGTFPYCAKEAVDLSESYLPQQFINQEPLSETAPFEDDTKIIRYKLKLDGPAEMLDRVDAAHSMFELYDKLRADGVGPVSAVAATAAGTAAGSYYYGLGYFLMDGSIFAPVPPPVKVMGFGIGLSCIHLGDELRELMAYKAADYLGSSDLVSSLDERVEKIIHDSEQNLRHFMEDLKENALPWSVAELKKIRQIPIAFKEHLAALKEHALSPAEFEEKMDQLKKTLQEQDSGIRNKLSSELNEEQASKRAKKSKMREKQPASKITNSDERLELFTQAEARLKTFAEAHQVPLADLTAETKEQLRNIFLRLDAQEQRQNFAEKIQAASEAFNDIGQLGVQLGIDSLIKAGTVGQNAIKIGKSLSDLQGQFPALQGFLSDSSLFGQSLSGLMMIQPYIGMATAAIQIGMALFGKKKEDPFAKQVFQHLREILTNLSLIRQEFHGRFDRIDVKLEEILSKIDTVYFALKKTLQINHQVTFTTLNVGIENLGDDIKFSEDLLSQLVKEFRLDRLKELLDKVEMHRDGKWMDQPRLENIRDLTETTLLVEQRWLLDNLVSDAYNGALYSTDSTRQDKRFVGSGIHHVEETLGYLADFARTKLGFEIELPQARIAQLPNVDLWSHSLQAALSARLYATQAYDQPLNEEFIDEFSETASRTIALVDVLAQHGQKLFSAIFLEYAKAAGQFNQKIVEELAVQITQTDASYTLKQCLENGWIDFNSIKIVQQGFIKKLIDFGSTAQLRVPVSLLLAHQFGLGQFNGSFSLTRNLCHIHGMANCKKKHHRAQKISLGAHAQISLNFNFNTTQLSFLLIKSNKPSEVVDDWCMHKEDTFPRKRDEVQRECDAENAISDSALLSLTGIAESTVDGGMKAALSVLSTTLAVKIASMKQSAKPASELKPLIVSVCDQIYNSATQAVIMNKVAADQSLDKLKVMHAVALAYTKLIGLPIATQEVLQQTLLANPATITSKLTFFNTLPTNLGQALTVVNNSLLLRHSEIQHKMQGVLTSLANFRLLSRLYNSYHENLNQWLSFAGKLNAIQNKISQLELIHRSNARYFNALQLQHLKVQAKCLSAGLQTTWQYLQLVQEQLKTLNFKPTILESLDGYLQPVPETASTVEASPLLRRGQMASYEQLQAKSLVEIIATSTNPYEDIKTVLSALPIEKQASYIQARDAEGATALHAAAKIQDLPLITLLLAYDAQAACLDQHGKKPIDYLPEALQKERVLLSSREIWQADAKDLGFSIARTVALLEEAAAHIEQYPVSCFPAVVVCGKARGGKSSLINHLHGTDYALKYDKSGRPILEPSGGAEEIAVTGSGSISVTALPSIYEITDLAYVDMPGFEGKMLGVSGNEEHIRTGVSTQLVAKKFETTQAILVAVTDAEVYDDGFTILREVLQKVGAMLIRDPDVLSRHLLFVITKTNSDRLRLAEQSKEKYESFIYDRLTEWFDNEISKVTSDHVDYPIKLMLERLTMDKIVLANADDVTTRTYLTERIKALPIIETQLFNFAAYHKSTELFKRFLEKVKQYRSDLNQRVAESFSALCSHWEREILDPLAPLAPKSSYKTDTTKISNTALLQTLLAAEQQQYNNQLQLVQLINLFKQQLKAGANSVAGVVGSEQEVTKTIAHLMDELALNEALFAQLEEMAGMFVMREGSSVSNEPPVGTAADSVFSDFEEEVLIAVEVDESAPDCSGSAWPFPGACGASLAKTKSLSMSELFGFTSLDFSYEDPAYLDVDDEKKAEDLSAVDEEGPTSRQIALVAVVCYLAKKIYSWWQRQADEEGIEFRQNVSFATQAHRTISSSVTVRQERGFLAERSELYGSDLHSRYTFFKPQAQAPRNISSHTQDAPDDAAMVLNR